MNRYLPWLGGAILVLVIATVGITHFHGGSFGTAATSTALAVPDVSDDGGPPPTPPVTKAHSGRGKQPVVGTPAEFSPPSESGLPSLTMIAILVLSVIAAAIIGGLVVGLRVRDPTDELTKLRKRIKELEDWRRRTEPQVAPPMEDDNRDVYAIYRRPLLETPPSPALEPARPRSSGEPKTAPVQPPPPRPVNEIVADYQRLLSGTMSRSSFQNFFEAIGSAGPVQPTADHNSIVNATTESCLTALARGSKVLVFPSYEFVSNAANQFSTIASVPEAVSALFDLQRDDGEIVLERPAIFDGGENYPVLRSKGIIRGFDG
jgi:hypothetical protein